MTSVKKKWIFNIFEKSTEKISDLNKLVSVIYNNKNLISFLNEFYKIPMMKWKVKNISVNKLIKQIKMLILILKIIFTISVSVLLYSSVTMS